MVEIWIAIYMNNSTTVLLVLKINSDHALFIYLKYNIDIIRGLINNEREGIQGKHLLKICAHNIGTIWC